MAMRIKTGRTKRSPILPQRPKPTLRELVGSITRAEIVTVRPTGAAHQEEFELIRRNRIVEVEDRNRFGIATSWRGSDAECSGAYACVGCCCEKFFIHSSWRCFISSGVRSSFRVAIVHV